jgi:amino acid transporter
LPPQRLGRSETGGDLVTESAINAAIGDAVSVDQELPRGQLGLTGAVMQCITHIAPAIAALFFTQAVVGFTGTTAPLAYLLGVLITLMLGSTLVQYTKHLPSAGGYYTYISRALHPRFGFMTAWVYILYTPLVGGPIFAYFGYLLQTELEANYGIHLPWLWWVSVIVGAPVIALLSWRGITLSTRAIVLLGGVEMLIVFALAIFGFAHPGSGGVTVQVFNPAHSISGSGFALAVVFSLQGLTGWEGAAPLGEETKNPERNIPRATILSIVLLGTYLVVTFWGIMSGWGMNKLGKLVSSPQLPGLVLAHKYWGGGWVFLLGAFFSSSLAVCLATNNVTTRMWFQMGRSGSLPKALAKVHPVYKSPTNAILLQLFVTLAVGLGVGSWLGPQNTFFFLEGLILVIAVAFIYIIANIGVGVFYWREHRQDFNWILHIIFPVISSAGLLYAFWKSFQPFPKYPFSLAPWVDGIWILIGVGVLVLFRMRGREDWLLNAGKALGESEVEPQRTVGPL